MRWGKNVLSFQTNASMERLSIVTVVFLRGSTDWPFSILADTNVFSFDFHRQSEYTYVHVFCDPLLTIPSGFILRDGKLSPSHFSLTSASVLVFSFPHPDFIPLCFRPSPLLLASSSGLVYDL